MAAKAPEQLLDRRAVQRLLCLGKNRATELFTQEWAVPGGTKYIGGKYLVPASFFQRWVESRDLALRGQQKEAA